MWHLYETSQASTLFQTNNTVKCQVRNYRLPGAQLVPTSKQEPHSKKNHVFPEAWSDSMLTILTIVSKVTTWSCFVLHWTFKKIHFWFGIWIFFLKDYLLAITKLSTDSLTKLLCCTVPWTLSSPGTLYSKLKRQVDVHSLKYIRSGEEVKALTK